MRKVFVFSLALAALLVAAAQAGYIAPALQAELAQTRSDVPVSVIVHLSEQAPVAAISQDLTGRKATRKARHAEIVQALKDASRSQEPLLDDLSTARASGDVVGFTRYWIANLVVVQALPAEIERIAARDDVAYVERNFVPEVIETVVDCELRGMDDEVGTRGIGTTPGVEAIRSREVWEVLGIDGSGALIASLDTGVDADHPAIDSRWRGVTAPADECWLDVIGSDPNYPSDFNSHGTHTVGTMCGLAPDDTIGVAPGAQWIACNAIDQGASGGFDNDIIEAFQWFADPDGNPFTVDDVPDVVQNSWGVHEGFSGYYDCDDRWWAVIDNCEAAGVVVVWSAGNEGTDGLRSPADRADNFYNCFSVGSTLHTFPYTISSFSSRGPSTCPGVLNPDYLIKPEISAPGSDIYSSVPGGGYGYKSGTSMAGPHVSGVVALMRSANPDLEVDLIKQVIMETATDLGNPGEDNTYGWGIIDAFAAVEASMSGFGTLEGMVTNASFGNAPIAGARIEFAESSRFLTSDASGQYSGNVAPGTHEVTCVVNGLEPSTATVTVNEDQVTVQDFALIDAQGPAITEVTELGFTTDELGPYTITARVFDHSTVANVQLHWNVVGSDVFLAVDMSPLGGDLYTADIPGQVQNSLVNYWISASDGAGQGSDSEILDLVIAQPVYADSAEDPGDANWQLGVAGDDATTGLWVRLDPNGTEYESNTVQTEDDHTDTPGVACYVTGDAGVGGTPGAEDVDNGATTLVSPVFELAEADKAFVSYYRWYTEDLGFNPNEEFWQVQVTADGTSWVDLEYTQESAEEWLRFAFDLTEYIELSDQVQVRFIASDYGSGTLVEAAVDDFEVATFVNDVILPVEDTPVAPANLALRQNRPNPFNPSTTISFALPQAAAVDLGIYTVDGRRVATLVDGELSAGDHQVNWHGRDSGGRRVASGTYFYRLVADDQVQVRRMLMVK